MVGARARPTNGFSALREFVRKPRTVEACELCRKTLGAAHQHLLNPQDRKLICACDACAILFHNEGQSKYKRVPRRIRWLKGFHITDSQWDGLMMPINMAFFFKSTPAGRVIALYPSPAGATESLLGLDTWDEIAADNPALLDMESDVEALLVNRLGYARGLTNADYYMAPIDECFKLVGLIRSRWQGLSGGAEVWKEVGEFFEGLRARSTVVNEAGNTDA
jgi:hypothetical protein